MLNVHIRIDSIKRADYVVHAINAGILLPKLFSGWGGWGFVGQGFTYGSTFQLYFKVGALETKEFIYNLYNQEVNPYKRA